ncbi:type II/IV secretion system protein [Patescibacteria group bacterium]|nr:type II/IV secretion system protein [Patescibacteria group bacterium]
MVKKSELIKALVKNNLISQVNISKAEEQANEKKKSLEFVLISKQLIDEEKLINLKASLSGIEYINLFSAKINDMDLNMIPNEVSENYKAICFQKDEKTMKVGLVNPDDFKAIGALDFLAKKKQLRIEYFLISSASYNHARKQYESMSREVVSALQAKEEDDKELIEIKEKEVESVELEEVVKSAPVTKIVSVIIRHAVDGKASDIHIEPLLRETRVRYRIDGILHTSLVLPKNIHYAVVARIKVLAGLKLDETRIPQGGRIRLLINDNEIDFRVSIIPLVDTEKVVMRILDVTKGAPTLEELGFEDREGKVIREQMKKTYGIFLITGPTGSGKSTTLFSILNLINKEGVNISTLEDPVEYYVPGVNQSQIRPLLGYTFASGLRTLLRQDPDIMMVGEIRDNETAELGIHAALTGHLVLSTLHTNNAIGAIPRLIDMNAERFLLASTINVILAQRLVRRICSNCRVKADLPKSASKQVYDSLKKTPIDVLKRRIKGYDVDKIQFYKGEGCPRCGNTGYTGRLAITEIIDINDELRKLIYEPDRPISLDDVQATQTFIDLMQDGIIKALQGKTTLEEIFRVVSG